MVPRMFWDINTALPALARSFFGSLAAGGLFLLIYAISRNGLGGGDVKFMAVTGLYLTFYHVAPAMLYGTVLSAGAAGVLLLFKKIGKKDALALIPFLYAGIILTLLFAR
jgi:leader peptidase (prepilin peptidase)/N-methyltransferase